MPPPMIPLGASTRIVGVIGDPIGHSRSPAMHNAAFRALGLPYAYVAFRVAAREVGPAVRAVRALDLVGLNVTIPHKQAVIPHLDALSPAAAACGAVNTIINRAGRLTGDNTDAVGLARDLAALGVSPRSRLDLAIVIGAGGAARAAVFALGGIARQIAVVARRPARARALVDAMRRQVPAKLEASALEALAPPVPRPESMLCRARLVVNATPLGMEGEAFAPLDYGATPTDCLFYDLIYTARRTPFLVGAADQRRRVSAGLGMLLHQGAAAFELWTGRKPPIEVMRRALARAR
jgi:shikimate dehydrogenase